jgi:peptidoglycan/LPS O-acetylase OafA/YrhL
VAAALGLALLFLPAPLAGELFPLNPPAWSLFFELVANAAYGLGHRIRTAGLFLLGVLMLGLLVFTLLRTTSEGTPPFDYAFARTFFSFPLGVLIYRLRHRIPNLGVPSAVAVAILVLPLFLGFTSPGAFIFIVAVIFPLGIAVAANAPASRPDGAYEWIGLISFPLYSIHLPILMMARALNTRELLPSAVIGWGAVATCVLLAWLLARFYDPSARAWLDRGLSRRERLG